ncbi:MAG: DUF4377 domain-containing protein [Ascidiaceihabitans sp.]|jgi:hypothetical protein|nr:DUF4377 domain-containing protein [Ascidiaceihabitans sp.]
MLKLVIVLFAVPLFAVACMPNDVTGADGDRETFEIAANTASCHGVAPMRCLIVNGQFFYDPIDGYEHVEGRSATICTIATPRSEPLPADVGSHEYRRVRCD